MPLTRCSLSVHGALTEGVAENVSGKGREGNKEGKGTRGETSHHGVTYVTRVSAAPVEVEPRDDMMTGLAVIEGIDLSAEVPCIGDDPEVGCPDGARAEVLIASRHIGNRYPYCWGCWAREDQVALCGVTGKWERRDEHFRIVEVLR